MKVAPLHASFMLISIFGLLFTLFYVYPSSAQWGTAFMVVFLCMLVASFVSMSKTKKACC
ncbi:hypothetical protein COV11_03865 [Candidatus Woesearchaeota archaeon CG10_big_fil_rev_8_21_14_0_10_30_7]|nr:MAG: hypothetical protein COV11_03865 [Candidatus Woesearchaeota archaeon CG10_big_fil_rev_8_21_14_0_10_30_7]